MDLKDIKAIIDLMKKNSITEFEMERDDFKIKMKRSGNGSGQIVDESPPMQPAYLPAPTPPGFATAAPATAAPSANSGDLDIKSPMVGTFYRAPSPDAVHYAEIGTEVTPDSVVCIIEAMKVMNEIKAEVRGVVTQILVDNARPVEFGQPLFKIRPT